MKKNILKTLTTQELINLYNSNINEIKLLEAAIEKLGYIIDHKQGSVGLNPAMKAKIDLQKQNFDIIKFYLAKTGEESTEDSFTKLTKKTFGD